MISGSRSAAEAAVKFASRNVIFMRLQHCRAAPYTIPVDPCMPLSDAINSAAMNFSGPWLAGKTRDPV
jgi:hypothetical protein